MYTYPEESKARSRIPQNADDGKYVRGTSSAQGKLDGKSVLMTAGPSRHSGEAEQPVPYLRSALQYMCILYMYTYNIYISGGEHGKEQDSQNRRR